MRMSHPSESSRWGKMGATIDAAEEGQRKGWRTLLGLLREDAKEHRAPRCLFAKDEPMDLQASKYAKACSWAQ